MTRVKISDNRYIGDNDPCFIVAEIGINHNGDVNLTKKMIDMAKECGLDAVKFQTFKAKEFISTPNETYTYQSQEKKITESMLKMFKKYEFSEKEWIEIFDYCKSRDIISFSTPQNPSDLDFLLKIIDLPIIKVGSDDLTNLGLLKYYASKNKPMIISAGMAFMSEVKDAVNAIGEMGNDDLAVLHCISCYPTEATEVNLRKMSTIKQAFDVIVGFSDHTVGTIAAISAVALGAKIIEKHFTLDKNLPGPDHWFSADPKELSQLVQAVRYVEKALGSTVVKPTPREIEMRKTARRSIVAAKDIKRGELIIKDALSVKRPGTGLAPKFIKDILEKRAKVNIKKNELVTFEKIQQGKG
jgi:sialic acid synthase SpsE